MENTLALEQINETTFTGEELYCYCSISWKSPMYEDNSDNIILKLNHVYDDEDDNIFMYVNGIEQLKEMANYNNSWDWFIEKIHGFYKELPKIY